VFSERGPNFLNYVQYFQTISNTFFQGGVKKFLGGAFPSLVMGLVTDVPVPIEESSCFAVTNNRMSKDLEHQLHTQLHHKSFL